MDPEACVQRILSAIKRKKPDEAVDACEDLAEWLFKGGFSPSNIKDINDSTLLLLRLHGRDAAAKTIAEAQEKA